MKSIWYFFFKTIIKVGLFFYSKRIIVRGKENIPKKGAILFTVNHPNGLIDPLIVATNNPRINHFLVRAAVFKKSLVKKLLATLNLMPIYRIRDGASQLGKNKEIFEQCFQIFKKQEALMIFPEGSHNRKRTVRNLSKGFTRIVFGAIDKYPDLQIHIVPVGLTYQNASAYPSKVSLNYGKPIPAHHFYNKKEINISVVQLKNEVSYQMKKLSVHIPDDENYLTSLSLLNKAQIDFTEVEKTNKTIETKNFEKEKKPLTNYLKPLLLLLKINFIFPYLIWKTISKKIDEIEFVDTFRFGINLVTIPLFLTLQTIAIYYFFERKFAIIYLLISLCLLLVYSKFSATNTEKTILKNINQ